MNNRKPKTNIGKIFRKKLPTIILATFITVAYMISSAINSKPKVTVLNDTVNKANLLQCKIDKVVDGDTVYLIDEYNQEIKARLIGVDTPESKHPDKSKNTPEGKIATDYMINLLPKGKKVLIEYDVQKTDKYNRHLIYLFIETRKEELVMVNELLLEEGYAKLSTYPPNIKYVDKFTKIEEVARKNEMGFWSDYFKSDEINVNKAESNDEKITTSKEDKINKDKSKTKKPKNKKKTKPTRKRAK